MRLYTTNEERMVDVGTGSVWYSLYSTAMVRLSESSKNRIPLALQFLKTGDCLKENLSETLRQIRILKDAFSVLNPSEAVYDLHQLDASPPWGTRIASTITSCANMYTTADGKDLFTEVISLLEYALQNNSSVLAG